MAYSPPFNYQWQNPELVKTIYPFRLEKLRDFLVYYKEIDLWKTGKNIPVDPKIALEIVQEINRLNLQLADAKQRLNASITALKDLERKTQEFARNRTVQLLEQKKRDLQARQIKQNTRIRAFNDSVTWYQNYAKTHPEVLNSIIYQRREADLAVEKQSLLEINREIEVTEAAIQAEFNKAGLGSFEAQREQLKRQNEVLSGIIEKTTTEIARLPQLGKNGDVTPGAAVRWEVLKYARQREGWDQERLIQDILARFTAEPDRFPKWLQYMILHFSGMRYKSAHGSWASPRDLLEMVKIEEYEQRVRQKDNQLWLDQECARAIQALENRKSQTTRAQDLERIKWQIIALNDKYNRQTALIKFQTPMISQEVRALKEEQVLEQIKSMKDTFPPWVWKEIASRTELRLETSDENWEALTPEEVKERWDWKNRYWREIMDSWEGKDITGWRKEHEMTLSLVVTRAVCNEIAEHIQHLRGVIPAAGLTAKPAWYLKMQKTTSTSGTTVAYLKPPGQQSKADFKPGASILWLGWVNQHPNPWQITHPLEGINTLPPREARSAYDWNYRLEGSEYIREGSLFRPQRAGRRPHNRPDQGQPYKNWLRWTHEAIVVEVAEMAGGVEYVLTFETGQIGLRLHPLNELLNNPYVYIGYIPPAPREPENLPKMLARDTLLPVSAVAAPPEVESMVPFAISFEIPASETLAPEPVPDEKWLRWQSLTRRERQVVTLICGGKSTAEIAERMGIERSTVKKHLQKAMKKFGVHSRLELRRLVAEIRSSSQI